MVTESTPGENQETSTTTEQTQQTTETQATTEAAAAATTAATTAAEAKSAFGETWREEIAGDDAALLGRLKRYASPKELTAALVQAQKKISDGSYKKGITDKSTPEEIAEYRKVNGIPEAPAGYLEKLPNGLVIGDEDKPIMESFAAALHAKHAPPELVHTALEWYNKLQDEVEGRMHEANVQAKQFAEDSLRDKWGPDYRPNTNLINALVGTMPEKVQEKLFRSTTPDGEQIMNDPEMLQWLAQQARELNYTGATLPSGNGSAKSLESEINEFKTKMGDRGSDYWKGPNAEKNQARYRELLEIQERIKNRAA